MSEEKTPNGKAFGRQLLIGLIIATCSAAIGFGVSQMTVAFTVAKTQTEMQFLRDAHLVVRSEMTTQWTQNEKRISGLNDLLGKQVDLNKEIIGLVRDVFPEARKREERR